MSRRAARWPSVCVEYAREQRWYRSKSIPIKSAELEEVFLFGEANASDHCLLVLGVELEDAHARELRHAARVRGRRCCCQA